MFSNCNSLSSVKAMFTSAPGDTYTRDWLNNVSASGTFTMNANAEWEPNSYRGASGIPRNWTVLTDVPS